MSVLGVVTIGQSPRVDMVPEMVDQWPGADVREAGALDDLTADELSRLTPIPGDEVLTSRLRDGSLIDRGPAAPWTRSRLTPAASSPPPERSSRR
ncbi:AroM family protein [Acidipropionibacterium virtanenii]|uniref:AroM family protein n=1 Tax=Acidipropionibacterium virtanenii TaxID=2057246 RepID=UPI000DEC825D|nr:AroM family protein [Acidipropionibacterium virtanenii]